MNMRAWSVPAVLAVVLAGCIGVSSDVLAATPAPAWEPGYQWTFQQDGEGGYIAQVDAPGAPVLDAADSTLTMTVLNTEQEMDGEPVYHVETEASYNVLMTPLAPGLGNGMFTSSIGILRQSDLAHLGSVIQGGSSTECFTGAHSGDGGGLRFPLDETSTWAVSTGTGELWQAEVVGAETITVPAGTFDAWQIHFHYERSFGPERLEATTELWYAPEVQFFAKVEETITFVGSGEREERTASAELSSFSLVAGEKQQVPAVDLDSVSYDRPDQEPRIVTTAELPAWTEEDATIPLALEMRTTISYYGQRMVETVDAFGDPDEMYPSAKVVWEAYRGWEDNNPLYYEGDVWDFPLDATGGYTIVALLVNEDGTTDCQPAHRYGYRIGEARLPVNWQGQFEIPVDAGGQQSIEFGEFITAGQSGLVTLQWTFEREGTPIKDFGYVELESRSDFQSSSEHADRLVFDAWDSARWTMSWHATGSGTDQTGPYLPQLLGEDVTMDVVVDYGQEDLDG